MRDTLGRTIDYLRISVTDRCNLRCRYCMPDEGIRLVRHEDILSFEEILAVTEVAVAMGVTKVRVTGGEPLVRRGVVDLIRGLAGMGGILDLAMTTNATLLAPQAEELVAAGLHRVNVSLDTLDPFRYRQITRGGDVREALAGIEAACGAGLGPVKLNCVDGPFNTRQEIEAVRQYGRSRGLDVRVIRQMDFRSGFFAVVENGSGGDCARCNRLRLSSDGLVRPCLFSDLAFSVRDLGPRRAIEQAVRCKPASGGPCLHRAMVGIGG